MKSGHCQTGRMLAARVAAALGMILFFGTAPGEAAEDDASGRVVTCFEGPATEAAAKADGDDPVSRSFAEMVAGKLCEGTADEVIRECLGAVDDGEEDGGPKDYYACIGIVANPCIDSQWASNEFRSVVCAGTEEKVWLDIVHESLDTLRTTLDGEPKQRFEAMERGFFEFRNDQCGLVRMLREGTQPDLAYGACTTEAAARFAFDLRDMVDVVENPEKYAAFANAYGEQDENPQPAENEGTAIAPEDAVDAPETQCAGTELGTKSAPVRTDNPAGERAYLERLRCPDGSAPTFERKGSMGTGGYGHIVDLYTVLCADTGERHDIYMDMYFPGHVEDQAVKGFTLADE